MKNNLFSVIFLLCYFMMVYQSEEIVDIIFDLTNDEVSVTEVINPTSEVPTVKPIFLTPEQMVEIRQFVNHLLRFN